MIPLVFAQLVARWGQVLTLLLLSAAATAAAVSAPVFSAAVDRVAIEDELAAGDGSHLLASLPLTYRMWADPARAVDGHAEVLSALTDFDPVTTVEIQVWGLDPQAPEEPFRLAGRDGFCRHAVFRAGRCPVGNREVALPLPLAEATGLGVGDQVVLEPVRRFEMFLVPDGPPAEIVIVGVVEARDRADPYWAAGQDPLGNGGGRPAILTNRTAVQTLEHGLEQLLVDGVLRPGALRPERIPVLRAQFAEAEDRLRTAGLDGRLLTDLPRLLDRVDGQGRQARALLPVTAAPLVALCWLVVYLVVAHGISARRHEAGVVALRGARAWTRAAVVTTEHMVPVLVAVPVGMVTGHLLGWLAGPTGARFTVTEDQLRAAGLALAGTLLVVLVALRRELAAPVAQLLRQVPPRSRRLTVAAVELVVIALAVVVVADLRVFDRDLVGLMAVAPAVVMVAVVVLAARVVGWLHEATGGWLLRRGWLGAVLGARYLSRRPGATRLVVALGLVLGMLGFAVASADVAAAGRDAEAERTLGAARVLEVRGSNPAGLLRAVRAADPDGRYAMAAIPLPAHGGEPARLAVDSPRLAPVAVWPVSPGAPSAEQVAQLLRPAPPAEPIRVADGELELALTPHQHTNDGTVIVSMWLAPVDGGPPAGVGLPPLVVGERSYRAEVTGCPDGCRLTGLTVHSESAVPANRLDLTVHAIHSGGESVLSAEQLGDHRRWRPVDGGAARTELRATGNGLSLTIHNPAQTVPYPFLVVDAPHPLPVVTAGDPLAGNLLDNLDGKPVRVDEAAAVPGGLPGLGPAGVLMDLEYADLSTLQSGQVRLAQVWLAPDAPPVIVDRLREAGVVVTGERSTTGLRAAADRSGAALALRFFLVAAAVAVLVGLLAFAVVMAVDQRGWSNGLRDLRTQGVGPGTVLRAGLWSYGAVVAAAVVAGAVAVAAAWLATGDRLPIGVERSLAPAWPQWSAVLWPWTVGVAVLFAAAVAGGWWQRKEVQGGWGSR